MQKNRRKVAIFTGNRAEYGLQYPILRAIDSHPDLEYILLVSGAHLQEEFGFTKNEIEKDGFQVHGEIKLNHSNDTLMSTVEAIGSGILNLAPVLARIKPDFLVVYADRFEGFTAIITASQMNIPCVHIEGGDLTEGGALDDSVRHAMTKLAHLHFTTNEQAAERVRNLGEEAWRVFNVGLPALDIIAAGDFADIEEIRSKVPIDPARPIVLFTQHSVTTEFADARAQVSPTLEVLRKLAKEGTQIVATYPNNDAGGSTIVGMLEELKQENIPGVYVHPSLGRRVYHGVLQICGKSGRGVCVGNSSSGIKEAIIFGCPVVNIGSRQNGRLRAENVLDVPYHEVEIYSAVRQALFDEKFRRRCAVCRNPYGAGKAGAQIAQVLSDIAIDMKLLQKKMTY